MSETTLILVNETTEYCDCTKCYPDSIKMEEDHTTQTTLNLAMAASKKLIGELKAARKTLIESGMDIKSVNNTIRKAHAEASHIEVIDFSNPNLPQNLENYEPDDYTVTEPVKIPHGTKAQAFIKREPEESDPTIPKGWYKRHHNDEVNHDPLVDDDQASQSLLPDAQRMLDTQGEPIPQENDSTPNKKRRVRKIPKSAKYIDMSDASFTNEPKKDSNPAQSVHTFKLFLMKPDRRSAFITEVSQLDPEGAIVFSDRHDTEARTKRQQLVNRIKKSLDDTTLAPGSDHMTQILKLMCQNSESFFRVVALTDALHKDGIAPEEVAKRIVFDEEEGKAIIVDADETTVESDVDSTTAKSLLESFDSRLATNTLTSSFVDAVKTTNPGSSQLTSTPSTLLSSAAFSFVGSPIPTVLLGHQHMISHDETQEVHKNSRKVVKLQAMQRLQSDSLDMDEKQYRELHKNAEKAIDAIRAFPYAKRLPLNDWKRLIQTGAIKPPLPIDYHPRYKAKPTFLTGSFCQEAWPGVFRPCSSAWTEQKAIAEFEKQHGREPETLLELNKWIKTKYPPITPAFDPSKHPLEMDEYTLEFFGEVAPHNLAKEGASLNTPSAVPHCPRNLVTAKRFLSLHDLSSLGPYIANPLLCTLGPSVSERDKYHWFSIPVPKLGGDLVVRNVLFEHNSLSYPVINGRTMIGRCGVCSGLLALPDYITYLAYFWPTGLKPDQVTAAIKEVWQAQKIPVCWIHMVTDGRYIEGRKI